MTCSYRIGSGYNIHRTTPDRPLILYSIQIPSPLGLSGHSGADVAPHALMGALLGTIGQRDIGYHFPDTDKRYRGADSTKLLATVMRMVRKKGCQVIDADLTTIAQQSKLSSHIPRMIVRLRELLDTPCVNVKATIHKRPRPLGNSEGIAAQVVILFTYWSFSGR